MSKKYVDVRGWRYQVMRGLGESNWKARYQKPGSVSWKCVATLPWRKSAEEAQRDLDQLAAEKGWAAEWPTEKEG